jgi:hypothetical protein
LERVCTVHAITAVGQAEAAITHGIAITRNSKRSPDVRRHSTSTSVATSAE